MSPERKGNQPPEPGARVAKAWGPFDPSETQAAEPAPDQLALERIEIRRMPGFPRGGLLLEDLSPGINVIHGPNGAGKTTTAKAIEALLWPAEACEEGYELFGRYRLGGAPWTVELAPGRRTWQRNGVPAAAPSFPGESGRHRYQLSLTELLRAEDRAFAEQIVRESAGGYDVRRASEELGFGRRPAGYTNAGRDVRKARQNLAKAILEQERLQEAELQLGTLQEAQREAAAAVERVEELDRLVALAQAETDEARLRQERSTFPEWMARARGDEVERLDALRARRRQGKMDLEAAENETERARARRTETGLPKDGLPFARLAALRKDWNDLQALEQDRRDAERQVAQAEAVVEEEERRLGGPAEARRLAALGPPELEHLRQVAREGEMLAQKKATVETEFHRLQEDEDPHDEARLQQGTSLLSRWLRAPDPATLGRARRAALLAGLVVAGLALAGALLGGAVPVLAFAAASVGMLLAWSLTQSWLPRTADPREGYRQQFEELGLEPPDAWTDEGVGQRLDALLRERALAKEARRRVERRQELWRDLEQVEAEWTACDSRRAALCAELGLPPQTSLSSLLWLVERVGAWQTAYGRLRGEKARLQRVEAERTQRMQALARALAPLGYQELRTVAALGGAMEDLEARRARWEEAWQAEERAASQAEQARAEMARVDGEFRRLFQSLGLDPNDPGSETALRQAWGDLDRYREVDRQWQEAVWRLKSAREQVSEQVRPEMLELEELLQARQRAQERAAEEAAYREQITETQTRIKDAKKAHSLGEALAAHDAARERLRDLFREDAASRLGAWLAAQVQEESQDSERPQVFHQARRILTEITAGRYSLELEEGREPLFRALETETGQGRALDQLSSGTRVQLLLAVRVAFVESQEHGARLPLVFDEVLANSDDERARAVIEAVIALARSGRQVFYFTAQWDEVAKWRSALEGAGVAHRIIDLAAVRRGEEAEQRPLPPVPFEPGPRVPRPEGLSYQEYGRLLQVPGVDPYADHLGGVHLWHLLDDPQDLYRLMSLGFERWGPLRAVGERGIDALLGGAEPGTGVRIYQKASTAARVLEAAMQFWRIGRGRPVDAEVLKASGAVSATFLGRAAELAKRGRGDPRRLLEALEGGELARFQRNKIAELRAFLDQEGYLDLQEPLGWEALRARVLAEAAEGLREGRVSREHVERLIRSVGQPGARVDETS